MLDPLLAPGSIAVLGASRDARKVGHQLLANLIEGGFAGRIVAVNPTASEVLGLPCSPDLASAGEPVELAVIAVAPGAVRAAVEDAARAGAKAAIVITAGFAETGPEGAARERELAELCAGRGLRLLGPNCLGALNAHTRMNATFARPMPRPGGISVLSQSGAICSALLDWAAERGCGLAKLVSMGNEADVDETELLTALTADPDTAVIVGYLESIRDGEAFVQAAEAAASEKPVVILKAGTTEVGRRAAASHTGSLAGAQVAYAAAFRRAGVIRAEDYDALLDTAVALSLAPLPKGERVAILTNAGGPGILAADAVERAGLTVSPLSGCAAALRARLPRAASVANPIDVLGDADPERYVAALRAAQQDPSVDALIVILTPQSMTHPLETAEAIAAAVDRSKPVLAVFMGGREMLPARARLFEAGLPDFPAPHRAVTVLRAMADYAAWRRRPAREVRRFPVNRRRVDRVLLRHRRAGLTHVGEAAAKEVLRAYGFRVPEGRLVSSSDEAVTAARRVGFPVAMKVASPDVLHKTDVGGVRLRLADAEAVRDAFDLMKLRVARHAPEARLEGAYVERMAPEGREVIVGMTRDPQFGPMLMFGLGGIFVEVLKDVAFHLAPITAEEAMQMLRGTRSWELLRGVRGQGGVSLESVAACLQRVSQLATDFPQITELDINPLVVPTGPDEPIAVDARMTLREEGTS